MPESFNAEDVYGFYRPGTKSIYIDTDASPAVQARTLVHEALHACFDVFRLTDEGLDEEGVCGALDGPLTALFMDNPWLAPVVQNCAAGVPLPLGEPNDD